MVKIKIRTKNGYVVFVAQKSECTTKDMYYMITGLA